MIGFLVDSRHLIGLRDNEHRLTNMFFMRHAACVASDSPSVLTTRDQKTAPNSFFLGRL